MKHSLIILCAVVLLTACGATNNQSRTTVVNTAATTMKTIPAKAPTATPSGGNVNATHGKPHIGGPLSDFVGKYGQPDYRPASGDPNNPGNYIAESYNFFTDSSQNTRINLRVNNQTVNYLAVIGDSSWSDTQTKEFCIQYLPSDAAKYNAVGSITNYHSSVGDIVLNLVGSGMCQIYTGQA